MTIIIARKETNWQKPIEGVTGSRAYTTVVGESETRVVSGQNRTLLDGMIEAQEAFGQITWSNLTQNIAQGWRHNSEHGGTDRIVVIDAECASGVDIIGAMNNLHRAGN